MTFAKHDQIYSLFNQAFITRIIVSLIFKNGTIRAAVLFSEILRFG